MLQSTQDLFALVDHVPTPIFVLDVQPGDVPVYVHYNSCALAELGRTLPEFVGKTAIEVFGQHNGTVAYTKQRKTIMARRTRSYEYQMPIDDEVRIIRTTLVPQFNEAGQVIRLIGSACDVSVEWLDQIEPPKRPNPGSEVEQFVTMAAHDLRTPMRNVGVLAQMLEEDFDNHGGDRFELIQMLKKTSEKSMKLITNILAYAHTHSAVSQPVLYRLDLLCADIMQSIDALSRHRLTATGIVLSGEKNVAQVVLHNLIDNALKHGRRDQMHLTCSAKMIGTGMVEITLSDDGEGFANPGTAFLETGDFRVDSGYGLLAIRKMIRARGGEISATNDPITGGCCVSFTLPHREVTTKFGLFEKASAHNLASPRGNISVNAAGL